MEAKNGKMPLLTAKVFKAAVKYKYVLLVLAIGLILILLPTGDKDEPTAAETRAEALAAPEFSLSEQEERLRAVLSDIAGVGEVSVLLSLKSTSRRVLAESGDEALVVSQGSGTQSAVDISYTYPEYLGAAVVCSGADNAAVRLTVVNAVKAFTGLTADKISVIKMK